MQASRFEQVQRADGVDRKIGVRLARGPIVRRLRGRVNDQRDVLAVLLEYRGHAVGIADVRVDVSIPRAEFFAEFLPLSARGCLRSEEAAPHVVVDADDIEAQTREVAGSLRAD